MGIISTKTQLSEFLDIPHTLCFTGHRPGKHFPNDMNSPECRRVAQSLYELCEWCIINKEISIFRSGAAEGIDQIAFWVVHSLKSKYPHIRNIVDVPYKDHTKGKSQSYDQMLTLADEVVYVDTQPRYKLTSAKEGEYSRKKFLNRNMFMVSKSKYVIAFFDGSKGGTGHCFNHAMTRSRTIYRINPLTFEVQVYNHAE
ncbi:YspA [Listeria phage LIS04]|nr:YspA [Listeria phage LIS04]